MKVPVKMLLAAVFVGAAVFGAGAQTMSVQQDGSVVFINSQNKVTTKLNNSQGNLYLGYGINGGTTIGHFFAYGAEIDGTIYGRTLSLSSNLYVTGIKSFIHPHPTDDSKIIKYIAIESGEALTLACGTAKTVNGEATVALPEHFSLCTSKDAPVTVILTPEGAPVLLYTKQKSKEKIVVAMKKSDLTAFGDVEFAFQVTGVRDGFENQDVIVDLEKLYAPKQDNGTVKNDVQKRIDALNEKTKAILQKERDK